MIKRSILFISLLALSAGIQADSFQSIKDHLAAAPCVSIDFLSILHSDVFSSVDTQNCSAYLARDGRYLVAIGTDVYLCDNRLLYSYSASNNQVVEQKSDSAAGEARQLAYLTRLDELYKTTILESDKQYKLTRRGKSAGSLPDSMTVTIDKSKGRIVKIEYFDINEERVSIVLLKESLLEKCDESRFMPNFPDSVETVKL